MKKKFRSLASLLLACSLVIPAFYNGEPVQAGKAPKLGKTRISVKVNKTVKIKLISNGVKKISKVKWSSDKKCVKITSSNKKAATVKGIKKGSATVTAVVNFKAKASSKIATKKLKCKVSVTAADPSDPTATSDASANRTPQTTASGQGSVPAATSVPSPTPVPTPTPTPGPANLLSALGKFVNNVGVCISYSGQSSVADDETTAFITENYNSLTAENEMKPEAVLGYQASLIKVSDSSSISDNNIIIPDGYTEENVPKLNYENIDKLLKYASENGLRIRYHGLLWHEQTSNWFFREGFNANNDYVSPEIMDKRIEYYITNVMNHVYSSDYPDVVYCWDVVNEYFHMTECICKIKGTSSPLDPPELAVESRKTKPETVKCFAEVYGDLIFEDGSDPAHSPVKTNPEYVKKAFAAAYKVLEKFGKTDSVELVYNDYDTNFEDARNTAIAVAAYVNSKDDINPEGKKLLTTIGMQCHDKLETPSEFTDVPRWTIESHKATMDAFKAAGLNFQITEMDIQLKGQTDEDMLKYWADFVTLVISEAKSGAKITGYTWWGLYDKVSWIVKNKDENATPLLCGDSVADKKDAYYKVIDTAYEHYWD